MKKQSYTYMKNISIAATLLLTVHFSYAQKPVNAWSKIKESSLQENKSNRYIVPDEYEVMGLNIRSIKNSLKHVKMKGDGTKSSAVIIALPNPDGSFSDYEVYKNTTMHPNLAANFPSITTYNAVSVDNAKTVAKLDITPHGFHAMILSKKKGTIFIDPYTKGDVNNYQIYYRKDYTTNRGLDCSFSEQSEVTKTKENAKKFGSCELRTYRLAVACTGEYAAAVGGGTVTGALAAQVTTMNRVNGIYERDMAVTLTIIGNNNLIIYTNASTDPYTNNSAGALIGENQTNVDAVIGSSNYDIGHVFTTGGGGLAGFGVVCSNSSKARGVTGRSNPQGDAYDLDYVAQERGHQFGGIHSFNNSCSGNRNNSTAYEPGSGSTIMAYAGICTPNVKNNSDDFFHGISLEQIGDFITTNGNSCAVKTPLTNNAPIITSTNIDGSITIPANNPFALTANATDADGDALTYTWEQMDKDISDQPPLGTSTDGPNFRAFKPAANNTRYFPRLILIQGGGPYTWEKLPTVSRTMNFRAVVRDNASGGGCNDHADASITIDENSGPLLVTSPNSVGAYWNVGHNYDVMWDVAGTDAAPVSCSKVDIFLSIDNGNSFPIQLANDVDNNGVASIVAPNNVTTNAKVMVICSNGTFFDISDFPHKIQVFTAVNDLKDTQAIQSYYNNGKIELSFTNATKGNYDVSVSNSLGQKVMDKTIGISLEKEAVSIPFTNTSSGIYYITVSHNKTNYTAKFHKN